MLRHNIASILESTSLFQQRPDYLVILPWNITAELKQKNAWLAEFSTDFVTAVTRLEVI